MFLIFIITMVLGVLLLIAAAYIAIGVGTFLLYIFLLATGRKATLERWVAEGQAAKAQQQEQKLKHGKGKGGFHFLGYPSPLNNWGLWN